MNTVYLYFENNVVLLEQDSHLTCKSLNLLEVKSSQTHACGRLLQWLYSAKNTQAFSASNPAFPQTPFWEDTLRIPFINKLWCPAEKHGRQRLTKRKTIRAEQCIIKLLYELPDPFSPAPVYIQELPLFMEGRLQLNQAVTWTQNTTLSCRHSSEELQVLVIIFEASITRNRSLSVSLWLALFVYRACWGMQRHM